MTDAQFLESEPFYGEESFDDDMKDLMAATTHAANRAWCEFNGDNSQPHWDDAPTWQKESAIAGVAFHLNNENADDAASHNSWMEQKLADGWKYGPVKDPAAKEHPCIVPFDQLPREQQFKDKLFRTIVHAMAQQITGA